MATSKLATHASRTPPRQDEPAAPDRALDEVDEASAASMDASDPPAFGGATGVGSVEGSADDRQRRISERAHELWLQAGAPEGVALDFWLAAEREIEGGTGHQGAGR